MTDRGPAGSVKRKRILIVDDDDDAREILGELLGALGHDTLQASSGSEAVEQAERAPLDIVLIDLGLPDVDGFEVARRIRNTVANSGARLVALTGYSDEESRRTAAAAGFDEFVVKPALGNTLEALVSRSPN